MVRCTQTGPLQIKGDGKGRKEHQELLYLLLVGRAMPEDSRCSMKPCFFFLKNSLRNTWLGPLDFTQLQTVLSIAKPHGRVVGVDPQLPHKAQNLNTEQLSSQLLG